MSFDTYYPSTPFDDNFTTNQRTWYSPYLRAIYHQRSIYSFFVRTAFNLGDVRAPSMIIPDLIPPHADIDPLTARQKWLPASHIDSRQRTITFSH